MTTRKLNSLCGGSAAKRAGHGLRVTPTRDKLREALQRKFGRLPVAGIPRLTRMKPGQGRFTLGVLWSRA